MAIATQTAMPTLPPTTRPQPAARAYVTTRHVVLSPAPEPRLAGVVLRLAALMAVTAFAVGFSAAIALALVSGTLNQLGH
jgi:hypothetical protein